MASGRRRKGDADERESWAMAKYGCRCERCWTAAEFFRAELGDDYGLAAAPGKHDPPPRIFRERNRRYVLRTVQLARAEEVIEARRRRRAEDAKARRLGLEPLTREDRFPMDGLRARRYR